MKVEWDYIGEGYNGEYDPSDPNDVQLLRFWVVDEEGDDVPDCSYCTLLPADTAQDILDRYANLVLACMKNKRNLQNLTWLTADDVRGGTL